VLVTLAYRVGATAMAEFVEAMRHTERHRRRTGAYRWGLFRDLADPDRFLETFVVDSWAEHLRQHDRLTVADREVEERALSLQQPGTSPVANHLVAARPTSVVVNA
jgi:hypothetical protein